MHEIEYMASGQIKNKYVLGNRSEISGRVDTYFFNFFLGKNMILYILKGISPFKMYKIIFF